MFSDFITTLAVLVGLLLYRWTLIPWIDGALALLVAIHLLFTGFKIVKNALGGLLDAVDRDFLFHAILVKNLPLGEHPNDTALNSV